ncbi:hypothetical protein SDC9_166624 [bioreactor metagenome]|uniref:Uncharacterized protein n=1 Tax=bioreactor metagenome TaxID=1076179 RepID=A0A645FXK5_9ZZZZ
MYISEVEYWYGDMEKWAIESNPTKSIQGIPLIFQNCTVGQKWKGHDDDGDGDIYNIEVMSVNEEVQTPAGLFKNCIKVKVVEADDINDAKYFWINPKCGVVKKVDGNDITLLYEKNF